MLKIVPDSNTLMVQIKTGEVQLTDAVSAIQYPEAQKLENSVVTLRDGTEWTHMDLKYIGALADKRVRQALDFATPKQQIVDQLLNGLATVGFGDQAPGTPWINPNIQARPYDLDAAAKLLEEAGFKKNANGILEKDGEPLAIEHWVERATRACDECNRSSSRRGKSWASRPMGAKRTSRASGGQTGISSTKS